MLQKSIAYPGRFEIFFHAIKTVKLLGALLTDPQVALLRKILFIGAIALLLFILFFPDAIDEVILSTVLPLVGTVLGVPLDAGIDWAAFALLAVNLLRIFPADAVAYHYSTIFQRS